MNSECVNHLPKRNRDLKVLSREKDLAKSGLIRKLFIKGRGAEVLRKIGLSPILWEPFKDSAPSRTAVGYLDPKSQRRYEIHCAVGIRNYGVIALILPRSLYSVQASFRPCQYRGAFIAPLPTENKNILGIKCSLRHWKQILNNSLYVVNKRPLPELFAL